MLEEFVAFDRVAVGDAQAVCALRQSVATSADESRQPGEGIFPLQYDTNGIVAQSDGGCTNQVAVEVVWHCMGEVGGIYFHAVVADFDVVDSGGGVVVILLYLALVHGSGRDAQFVHHAAVGEICPIFFPVADGNGRYFEISAFVIDLSPTFTVEVQIEFPVFAVSDADKLVLVVIEQVWHDAYR